MKKSMQKNVTKTNNNLSRLHNVMDRMDTIIKVDHGFFHLGMWHEDENGLEYLVLEDMNGDELTFSNDAIEHGTIKENGITMMADDGQEYLLAFFSTKAATL